MIEAYWDEVFGDYKGESGKFSIPGFPEPLMSKHFGVKNIIGENRTISKQSFKLCEFEPQSGDLSELVHKQTLAEAIQSSEFWNFQKNHNSLSENFMRRLLPFLCQRNFRHFHFYITSEEGIVGSAILGESSGTCFLFNLSIRESARGQGLARLMLNQMRRSFPQKGSFYWTVHSKFTFDGMVYDYFLID